MTYKRVLLKLSGEALMGDKPYGIDPAIVQSIAEDVEKVTIFYTFCNWLNHEYHAAAAGIWRSNRTTACW